MLFVAGLAVLSGLSAFGADGTWNAASSGNWNDSSKWLDGVIANGDDSSAVMLTGFTVTPNQDVVLNCLTIRAINFTLNFSSGNLFTMKNNPMIEVDPFPTRASGIRMNQPITGDGSVLTIKGGNIDLLPSSAITNFSRVDLKGVATLSPRYSRPVTDGDLRMIDSRINNNSQQDTGFLVAEGKLIVGPGQNVFRTGYTEEMTLPAVIEREAQGTVQITLPGVIHMFLADAPALTNAEGRLPPWMFYDNSGSYSFSTHTATDGISAFSITKFDLAAATDADTVRVNSDVTLAADTAVGALQVSSTLSFPGQTLTLGAPDMLGTLMLDTSLNNSLGSLTFTGTEGLVVANTSVSVAPQITGPIALSVLAGMDNINTTKNNTLLLNNAANDFSGGLHILVGTVSSTNDPAAFGPGPIYVRGQVGTYTESSTTERIAFGGQLHLRKGTLTNQLFLAGAGSEWALAALRLGSGTKVDSSITLTDAVAIRSDAGRAEISGSIAGDYSVRLWPDVSGVLVLSGSSSYTGGTMIVSPVVDGTVPGVVQVDSADAFGTGPVLNNGTLELDFSNDSFTTPLTGSGTFMQTNNTTVTFQNTVSQGTLFVDKGTVAVNGATNSFGILLGQDGQIQATTDTVVVLGADSSQTGIFYGSIADGAGKVSLVKRGTNTQVLAGTSSYTGETIVEEGTLRLGGDFSTEALPTLSIAPSLSLDAANRNASVTTNASGAVTAWASKGSVSATFTQSDPAMMPVYDSQAMNGLGGIRFSGVNNGDGTAVTNRLSCSASGGIIQQTIYAVSHPTAQRTYGGLIGSTGADNGIRQSQGASWDTGFTKWGVTGIENFAINGVEETGGFSYVAPHLLRTAVDTVKNIGSALSVGQYYDTATYYPRALTGSIGEILMYPRRLTPMEDSLITSYLMKKWKVGTYVAPSQILPVTTAMTVREGAVLDFNGASQTFASLVAEGTLRNSSTNLVTITFSSGKISGTVEGPINFVKVGSGALEVSQPENAVFSGKMTVTDGSVTLKSWRSEQLPDISGLTFHLDAARIENLETNAQNEVVTWRNTGVAGGDFVRDTGTPATTPPTYSATAFDGRKGVKFNATEKTVTNRLRNTVNTIGRTFFFLTQTDAYTTWSGIFGPRNSDYGIRLSNATTWSPYRTGDVDGFGYSTNYFINGVEGVTSFTVGEPYIFTVRANRDNWSKQWTLGNHYNWTGGIGSRGYNGLMGEVIGYSRLLTSSEQQSVEAYLVRKWMGVKTAENNIFSPDTTLELGPSGTLDLGQTVQTFSGLSGSGGSVTNGTTTLGGTLEVTVEDGIVTPFYFSSIILSDGLNIVFKNGVPVNGAVILEGGSVTGNLATFTLPTGFSASLNDNKLSVFRSGTLILVR
jgi:autotransporter-associated beta strand protein